MFINTKNTKIISLKNSLTSKQKVKILIIIREGSLGDAIQNREYFSSLKHFSKNIETNLFCLYPSLSFFKHLPNIDKIYSLSVSKIRKHRCWLSFLFYGLYFRFKKITYIIDYNPFDAKNWKFFTWLMGNNKVLQTKDIRFSTPKARTAFFLKSMGVPYYNEEIPIQADSKHKVDIFLRKNNINTDFIIMNCFASIERRTFSPETFNFFVDQIRQENINLPIVFLYQNTLKDKAEKYKELKCGNIFYFEADNPQDLFALISHPKHYLLISTCTAAVHVAAVYQKNSIVIHRRLGYQNHNNPNGKSIFSIEDTVNSFDRNIFISYLKSFFMNIKK